MRIPFLLLLLVAGAPPVELTPEPAPARAEAPIEPASASGVSPIDPAPSPTPATIGAISCEGLARHCGGWEGCVLVRHVDDVGGVARYEGLGPHDGHRYVDSTFCVDGACNEMCDPATGTCRPGLLEELPVACSRATPPSRAPFFCELVDGACVRHDLPTAPVGGRS
jgi:hypothetical protein